MAQNQAMGDFYVIAGLRRRYAKTLGLIQAGGDHGQDLAHLGAVIRMFSPEADLAAIAPVRPYRENRQRWVRDALTVLRAANEPLTAREVAKRVLAARGAPLDPRNVKRGECALYAALATLEGDGVERTSNRPKRWALGVGRD
jgi:hypothetical protein